MKSQWGTDLERGVGLWGCLVLKTPFAGLSCISQGSHFKEGKSVHNTPFWENVEVVVFSASIFAQILALKLPD